MGSGFFFERLKKSTAQAVGVVAYNQAIVGSIPVASYSSLVAYLISISLAGSEKKTIVGALVLDEELAGLHRLSILHFTIALDPEI